MDNEQKYSPMTIGFAVFFFAALIVGGIVFYRKRKAKRDKDEENKEETTTVIDNGEGKGTTKVVPTLAGPAIVKR